MYVYDLFCVASYTDSHSAHHEFTTALQEQWDVEDEGPVSDLLNIEITREGDSLVYSVRRATLISSSASTLQTASPHLTSL